MSQDELVDVVDENGNFLEVVAKGVAHEKGLLHKTIIANVVGGDGRWLLVKQAKDRQDAGQYVSPVGGHVTAGEDDINALKREANEEIGLSGEYKYEFIGKKIFNRHVIGRHENHLFIMYKIFSDQEPVLGAEDDGCKYFTEEELKKELKESPKIFDDAFHFVVRVFFTELL